MSGYGQVWKYRTHWHGAFQQVSLLANGKWKCSFIAPCVELKIFWRKQCTFLWFPSSLFYSPLCNAQVLILLNWLICITYLKEAQMDMNMLQENNCIAWGISEILMVYFILGCLASGFLKLKYMNTIKLTILLFVCFQKGWRRKGSWFLLIQARSGLLNLSSLSSFLIRGKRI